MESADSAPVNATPSYHAIEVQGTSWTLVDFSNGDRQSVVAFARINGCLFEITGTDKTVDELAGFLIVTPFHQADNSSHSLSRSSPSR